MYDVQTTKTNHILASLILNNTIDMFGQSKVGIK